MRPKTIRDTKSRNNFAAGVAITFLACAVSVWGGELEPPVPPGTPTMKPMDQLEPRRPIYADMLPLTITEPGTSWYLAESITTAGAGITVNANNVTIDLMGFTLEGGTGVGIRDDRGGGPSPHVTNVTVRNGTVTGWADQGIRLWVHSAILNVRTVFNGGTGIDVAANSLVLDSTARSNGGHGIATGAQTVVRDCVAAVNTENGIWVSSGSLVTHCVADNNYRNGIRAGHASLVKDNSVRGNSLSFGADHSGIWVQGDDNRVEGNLVVQNRNGLTIDGNNNVVVRNSVQTSEIENFRINGLATGNMIGTIRTSLTSAGPWDNLCTGCP